jgi:hypothetical protein
MSHRPSLASPLSLVGSDPVADRPEPVATHAEQEIRRVQGERGPRALGAQAGQWRWRSGRELWGRLR